MPNPETAVTVIEQSTTDAMVEWSLDDFPTNDFNRLLPTQTLMLPTDLLRPVVQVVKLNPDPKAGDVYTSRDTPAGHAAPTRVGLRKLATAAGISIVDEHRVDDGRDPDVIEVTCVAEMLMPTGQRIRATGTKRIDLNAQKWESDNHRLKFRSFFQEHVASRAQNRAIRSLLSLRGSYPQEVYNKPFAVVSFAPNMAHPEVRSRMLDVMAGASVQLYGGAAPVAQIPATIDVSPAADDDPAPATPTVLPGEKLAAAVDVSSDDPPWVTGATDGSAGNDQADAVDIVEAIRAAAAGSKLKGELTDPQKAQIGPLLAPLNGTGAFGLVVREAFGPEAVQGPTAAQAQAIITVASKFETPDLFVAAWAATADAIRQAAA